MNTFYSIVDAIKAYLETSSQVNTITYGDFFKIDLGKTTLYSIAHIQVPSISFRPQVQAYEITIIFADIVDESKQTPTDIFYHENLQDILNTQVGIANILVDQLRRGTLARDGFQLENDPFVELFEERFDHLLAGCVLSMTVIVKNSASICIPNYGD